MAQLNSTNITGNLTVTSTISSTIAKFGQLLAPVASGSNTYGPGSQNQSLVSNGSGCYWMNMYPRVSYIDFNGGTLGSGSSLASVNVTGGCYLFILKLDYVEGSPCRELQWMWTDNDSSNHSGTYMNCGLDGVDAYWPRSQILPIMTSAGGNMHVLTSGTSMNCRGGRLWIIKLCSADMSYNTSTD